MPPPLPSPPHFSVITRAPLHPGHIAPAVGSRLPDFIHGCSPFQSNNTPSENRRPKVIYTTTTLPGKQSCCVRKPEQRRRDALPDVGSGVCRASLVSAGFSDYYCKPEEIGTHKLIWLLPIIIVSILIVLINEAAAVFVPAPLHSFVAPEHQKRCHCSAPSAAARKSLKSA